MVPERLETIFKSLSEENQETLVLVAKGIEAGQKYPKKKENE